MSTYNIGFYEDMTKFIVQLSSNTYLIHSVLIISHFGFDSIDFSPDCTSSWSLLILYFFLEGHCVSDKLCDPIS